MYVRRFFKQFVDFPDLTGSIIPSSKALAREVVKQAEVKEADTVVEYGPGSGAITGTVLENLKPDATFFTIEINHEFVEMMKEAFPDVDTYEDSAANTRMYLEKYGKEEVDSVVSGLPWARFDDALQDELLGALLDVLRPGGIFATYTYYPPQMLKGGRLFRPKLRERFSEFTISPIVFKNVPPAVVYKARK
jgi:phospholipid N-methyltransferase